MKTAPRHGPLRVSQPRLTRGPRAAHSGAGLQPRRGTGRGTAEEVNLWGKRGQGTGPARTYSRKHQARDPGSRTQAKSTLLPAGQPEGGLATWTKTKTAAPPVETQSHRCACLHPQGPSL